MTKKISKPLTVLMASMLAITAAACSSEEPAPSPSGSAQPGTTDSMAEVFQKGKYDPPITLTTIKEVCSCWKFKDGETIENNVHTRMIKEKLGIDIKFAWTTPNTNNAFSNKLRLSLSANEELPDVVILRDTAVANQLIDTGKFIPVDELFDKYATKVYKDAVNADPAVWYPYMRDGKKYGLPIFDYSLNTENVMWIRQDWMEKFNLQAPKSIEDLENIMQVFKTKDPDGNGKDDTIPLTLGLKQNFNSAAFAFGWYGSIIGQWNKNASGSLEYGSIHPGAKQGLAKLKDWMAKGYISNEAGTMDETKAAEVFIAGKAGIVIGPHYYPDYPLRDIYKNVKDARFKAYQFPKGPDGKIGIRGVQKIDNGVMLINKANKHPESILLYYNYFFDNYANPKTGSEYEFGLAKGYDWDVFDGKPRSNGTAQGGTNVWPYTITYTGARIPDLMTNALIKLSKGEEPSTPFERTTKETRTKEEMDATVIVKESKDKGYIYDQAFTGAPTKTMESKWDLLSQMELETYNKIVLDKLPLDAFDTYVQQWKSSGGDKITEEVNQWYKALKK
ncbi:extracellular solute-binding protein [Paenibacillus sp. HJGM_3]|uniref:extracellular solute-binding protein n=1 Tax=Paenibacillus sp. HJGM_3 TaxID=3379816 RepID=UPI00385AE706